MLSTGTDTVNETELRLRLAPKIASSKKKASLFAAPFLLST
jgi:hypothetical protein